MKASTFEYLVKLLHAFEFALSNLNLAITWIKQRDPKTIILESSGGYEKPWVAALQASQVPVMVEHPSPEPLP